MNMDAQTVQNWLTFIAVLVALFGERGWRYCDNKGKKREARIIIKRNLEQLRSDLQRIKDERNSNVKEDREMVVFNGTSFSEVRGYYFLFSDLLLPNMTEFELSKYPATIEFFNHYKINIETIRKRDEEYSVKYPSMVGLTLATFKKLLERLGEAIQEFS